LADARARYLRIQAELGGKEVILSAEGQRGGGAEGQKGGVADERGGQGAVGQLPPDHPSAPPPAWRKGAPPIPTEQGIRVEAPPADLAGALSPWGSLEDVAREIGSCRRCLLCEGRKNTVPGEGSPTARLLFVGEGPGQTEDETGRPFVGRAGELLTQIIESVGLKREDVFICNAVKCRPPQNRKPLPDEMAACRPFLERQIDLVKPAVIVALGASAAEALLASRESLGRLRNRVHSYRSIPLVVTYHPAALLRNPNWKKPTWDDIRIARQLLDR
jgi:uracil-DNA glycosylase family 4